MELTQNQNNLITEVSMKFSLEMVILFGSRANNKSGSESDTDIAVKASSVFDDCFEIEALLASEFKSPQVIDLRKAPPLLLASISNGIPLYEREEGDFKEFKLYAFKRYIDYKPMMELRRSKLSKELKKI